ncbi:hypothetical protein M901_3216, partial [Bacteriovorax sp. DB6_IX]
MQRIYKYNFKQRKESSRQFEMSLLLLKKAKLLVSLENQVVGK